MLLLVFWIYLTYNTKKRESLQSYLMKFARFTFLTSLTRIAIAPVSLQLYVYSIGR